MATWYERPNKKQLYLFIILWFVGVTLCTLTITDFFTQSFIHKGSFLMYFIMIGATISVVRVWINYRKSEINESASFDRKEQKGI